MAGFFYSVFSLSRSKKYPFFFVVVVVVQHLGDGRACVCVALKHEGWILRDPFMCKFFFHLLAETRKERESGDILFLMRKRKASRKKVVCHPSFKDVMWQNVFANICVFSNFPIESPWKLGVLPSLLHVFMH